MKQLLYYLTFCYRKRVLYLIVETLLFLVRWRNWTQRPWGQRTARRAARGRRQASSVGLVRLDRRRQVGFLQKHPQHRDKKSQSGKWDEENFRVESCSGTKHTNLIKTSVWSNDISFRRGNKMSDIHPFFGLVINKISLIITILHVKF